MAVRENAPVPNTIAECTAEKLRLLQEISEIKHQLTLRESEGNTPWRRKAVTALRCKRLRSHELEAQVKYLKRESRTGNEWKLLLKSKQLLDKMLVSSSFEEDGIFDLVNDYFNAVDETVPLAWQNKELEHGK